MKLLIDNPISECLGIHLDGQLIRIVKMIVSADNQAEVISISQAPYNGILDDPHTITSMKEILGDFNVTKNCSIHVTFDFKQFVTTHVSIAEGPLKQVNRMAWLAFQQEINLESDDFIFDYERVSSQSNEGISKANLLAFSVEKSLTEKIKQLIVDAGYQTSGIFPLLFAYRNLISIQAWKTPTAILILEEKELRIGVIHNRKYIFTRTFKSGLNPFREYISQKVNTPCSMAILEKALNAKSDEYETPIAEQIREAFDYIAERMQLQIERAFKFYSGRLKLPAVERIYIYTESPILSESLAKSLEPNYSFPVKTLHLNEFDAVETGLDFIEEENDTGYALAAGAGLAAKLPCPNLLRTHSIQLQQRRTYRIKTSIMLTLSVIGLVCICTFLVQMALLAPRVMEKRSLTRQMKAHKTLITKEIIDAKSLLTQRRLIDLQIRAEHYALQGFFYEVATIIPPQLKMEHLEMVLNKESDPQKNQATDTKIENAIGTFEIKGIVTEKGIRQQSFLTKFIVELGSSGYFRDISKQQINNKEQNAYEELGVLPFRITGNLVYGTTEENSTK